jgi:spermidine synthase
MDALHTSINLLGQNMSKEPIQSHQTDFLGPANKTWAIFLISVLGLFLEMLLIRWVGTEVRIFAYLQNAILVVCFLGLGLGCFTCRQPVDLRPALIPLAFLGLLFAIPVSREVLGTISELLSATGDLLIWAAPTVTDFWLRVFHVALGLGMTYCLMVFILDIFVPIGRILGRLMDDHPRIIWAYSVNIAGSLIGTWLFVLLSISYQPPLTWFAILAVLLFFFLCMTGPNWRVNAALLASIILCSWFAGRVPGSLRVIWSPYQKLVVSKSDPEKGQAGDYLVTVNNTGYQVMIDSTKTVATNPKMSGLSQYDIPLLLHPNPQSFLIVGAGAGNDAAGGLRHGVKQITAVEIDPAIIALGREYHPDHPYSSPDVEVVNDDARSFFATTDKKFDVIVFGLLDSHTTTAMTNARLDHYVYTSESIGRAKSLLAPGGIMVLNFYAQKLYIADRMARVLRDIFKEEPIVFYMPYSGYGYGGVLFISGDLAVARKQIAQNPRLHALIDVLQRSVPLNLSYNTVIATDDWPYIYLQKPRIPALYYLLAMLLVGVYVRGYKRWGASGLAARWTGSHWHFFFLGAAFLLLEVQNVSKASVVLGNTWQVNAVIISGVLAMALLANLVVHRFPGLPLAIAYVGLIGTCFALYFIDLARFAFLPYSVKALTVGGLTTLPVLFSGIVFTRSFAAIKEKNEALGANMVGSLVGALLQSITFMTGIRALLLIVAGLYCLSFFTRPGTWLLRPGKSVPPVNPSRA